MAHFLHEEGTHTRDGNRRRKGHAGAANGGDVLHAQRGYQDGDSQTRQSNEGGEGSMKFSHAAWLGMFTGLDLMAERAVKSQDINELNIFINKYLRTVADFQAAHSEHMEKSLKNAGIGRETKEA